MQRPFATNVLSLFLCSFLLISCSSLPKGSTLQQERFSDAHETLVGDLYLPARNNEANSQVIQTTKNSQLVPAVIVVHGGGWTSRSGDMKRICLKLVREGFAVFNITYRLAPDHLYPKAVVDVSKAISWLQDNSDRLGIDKDRIAGWGYSAGAHLILLSGLNAEAGLKAIVAGGTPSKLTYWPRSPMVNKFVGHPMVTHRKVWEEASPSNHVKDNSPPVFLYHGSWDSLVDTDQMYIMEVALKEKGVEVQTHEASYLGHFGTYLFSGKSEKLGIDFLKEKLR